LLVTFLKHLVESQIENSRQQKTSESEEGASSPETTAQAFISDETALFILNQVIPAYADVFMAYFGNHHALRDQIYSKEPTLTESDMLDFLELLQTLLDLCSLLSSFGDRKSDRYKLLFSQDKDGLIFSKMGDLMFKIK